MKETTRGTHFSDVGQHLRVEGRVVGAQPELGVVVRAQSKHELS